MFTCRSAVGFYLLCSGLLHVARSLKLEDVAAGQQRLFSPTDVPVSVVREQKQVSVVSTDIKSCLSSASSASKAPFRVRFQKLKGKTATFTRTLLDQEMIKTYASKQKTVSRTDIANCVSLAEAGGFVGFSFNDGTCNLFNIKPQSTGCVSEGKDVFYVQDSYWAPKGRPGGFSLRLIHGLTSIVAKWEPCCPNNPSTAAKFQLSWNNTMVVLNKTTFHYKMPKDARLCTDNLTQVAAILKDVALQAFDDAGTLMKTATATLIEGTVRAGKRYVLRSSNCLYYDSAYQATLDKLDTFCRTELYSTMFIAHVGGDFVTYRNDLIAMSNYTPPVAPAYHYVGLLKEGSIWTWQSGLLQPTTDTEVFGTTNQRECVQPDKGFYFKLMYFSCEEIDSTWVCHDYCR